MRARIANAQTAKSKRASSQHSRHIAPMQPLQAFATSPTHTIQRAIGNRATSSLLRSRVTNVNRKQPPSIIKEVLRSPGHALDAKTRAFMEQRFNYNFSGVRVHTDSPASQSAKAVNALAYTVGNNIVFSAGQYDPTSSRGRQLVAHELSHVVQQSGGSDRIHRSIGTGVLQRAAIYNGRILDEGSCADLVAGSKWICCDPDNGMERKGKTKDIDGNECPSEKFAPIFTCDTNCTKALEKGCSDSDDWMALPKSRFARGKCGQDLVICANEKFTHAYVRDKSEREAWEVSKAIPAALGLSPDFKGVIYGDETDADFKKDKRCGNAPPPPPKEKDKTAPKSEGKK